MGSLFSRPHATALFVVDGVSKGVLSVAVVVFILYW